LRGENEKDRPLVIITATSEIRPDEPVVAVAITTQIPNPLPEELVELPWHRNKHAKTGLNKPCAAVCNWVVELQQSDIQTVAGVVPAAKLVEIIKRLPGAPKDKTT
jgi:mRNA-degrading endonuclease toxin of MazEF toxin-antitoxin module